jgi:hypothetical protein
VDALAALIASATTGSLARQMAAGGDGAIPGIEIFAFTRATRGRIRLAGRSDGVTASVEYAAPSSGAKSSREGKGDSRRSPDTTSGDLEQSRRITERTILAIAKLVEGRPR